MKCFGSIAILSLRIAQKQYYFDIESCKHCLFEALLFRLDVHILEALSFDAIAAVTDSW